MGIAGDIWAKARVAMSSSVSGPASTMRAVSGAKDVLERGELHPFGFFGSSPNSKLVKSLLSPGRFLLVFILDKVADRRPEEGTVKLGSDRVAFLQVNRAVFLNSIDGQTLVTDAVAPEGHAELVVFVFARCQFGLEGRKEGSPL